MSGEGNVLPQMSKMFLHHEVSQKTDNQWTNSRSAHYVNFPLSFPLSAESEAGESEANFSVVLQ